MLIDMHTHTSYGFKCSDVTIEDTIRVLKEKAYDGVLITDHESEAGYKAFMAKNNNTPDFLILRGFEVSTKLGDMITILPLAETILDLDTVINRSIHPLDLIDAVHEEHGVIGIVHMFRDEYGCIGNMIKSKEELERIIEKVDFIEVHNGAATENANRNAEIWANRFGKAKIKGSDSHHFNEIGICGTRFSMKIESEEDLIFAISNKCIKDD